MAGLPAGLSKIAIANRKRAALVPGNGRIIDELCRRWPQVSRKQVELLLERVPEMAYAPDLDVRREAS